PGPTDIAWDLAGAIVEWEMDSCAEEAFLDRFTVQTRDRVGPRIDAFVVSYAVFRASYCRMAAHAMRGTEECDAMLIAAERYRMAAVRRLGQKAYSHREVHDLSISL